MSPEVAIAAVFALAAIEAATGSIATDSATTKAMIVRAKRIIVPSKLTDRGPGGIDPHQCALVPIDQHIMFSSVH
jgi:hypothetical protein